MALYSDNDNKYVMVINGKIPTERVINGLLHASLGLVHRANGEAAADFLPYDDADESGVRMISRWPVILLKAKNGNQLRRLRQEAMEAELTVNDFVGQMMGSSAEEQRRQTREAAEADLDYWAVCLFGDAEIIAPLTRRFSLYRG